jgi:hypothetical protein
MQLCQEQAVQNFAAEFYLIFDNLEIEHLLSYAGRTLPRLFLRLKSANGWMPRCNRSFSSFIFGIEKAGVLRAVSPEISIAESKSANTGNGN